VVNITIPARREFQVVAHVLDELCALEEISMADLIYILLSLLFLAASFGFIVICERLMEDKR
jgi:hypothetical protein